MAHYKKNKRSGVLSLSKQSQVCPSLFLQFNMRVSVMYGTLSVSCKRAMSVLFTFMCVHIVYVEVTEVCHNCLCNVSYRVSQLQAELLNSNSYNNLKSFKIST